MPLRYRDIAPLQPKDTADLGDSFTRASAGVLTINMDIRKQLVQEIIR